METPEEFLEALSRLLRENLRLEVVGAERMAGGTNNALYALRLQDGSSLAAKHYFFDERRRLEREYQTLSALVEHGFAEVPRPIARFDEINAGVYEFIEGRPLRADEFTNHELDTVADYLVKLHGLPKAAVSRGLPPAFTSVASLSGVADNVRGRAPSFSGPGAQALHPLVRRFLAEAQVLEKIESVLAGVKMRVGEEAFHRRVADESLRLSSVDIGPHNMLWRADGSLAVLDFEYGGWDHPARTVAELLEHDQMSGASASGKERLLRAYAERTSLPQEVVGQISDFRQLLAAEWVMIFLSATLPKRLERTRHSRGPVDVEALVEKQVAKATKKLESMTFE